MTDATSQTLAPLPGLVLAEGESVRAVFRPDLDEKLRYATSAVALTSQRVCWQPAGGAWLSVVLSSALRLDHREYAGLGELRLADGTRTLARFFHTLAAGEGAMQFLDAFETQQGAARSRPRPVAPADDQDSSDLPVSGKFPLLRLLRFARPHLPAVLVGFALTLASTAAGLIPPYLTMPLVDRVLVPGQAGQLSLEVALPRVALYLGGLGAAAVVGWLLAWAQGALLAFVTERSRPICATELSRTFSDSVSNTSAASALAISSHASARTPTTCVRSFPTR